MPVSLVALFWCCICLHRLSVCICNCSPGLVLRLTICCVLPGMFRITSTGLLQMYTPCATYFGFAGGSGSGLSSLSAVTSFHPIMVSAVMAVAARIKAAQARTIIGKSLFGSGLAVSCFLECGSRISRTGMLCTGLRSHKLRRSDCLRCRRINS